jgi:hypothetical protein
MLRPGKCIDVYYPDPQTAKKQCFRTTVNTKFQAAFTNLGGGTSAFVIPPNNGLQDVMIMLRFPSNAESSATGLALPRGWGYAAINKISFRVGGSNQFFLTGAQILQAALENCSDAAARDSLFAFGGSACTTTANFTADNYAYVWLKLPWCTPSAEGKMPPLPSDLLTQQVQITCELNPISDYCSNNSGTVPTSLRSGTFTVQQVQFINQGDALARRVDMTSHSLSYPLEFIQQEVEIPLQTTSAQQTVSITGFRSGEVKALKLWVTSSADSPATARNPLLWYRPFDVIVSYAGDQYARFDGDSGGLWNLVNSKMVPEVANTTISFAASAYTATASTSRWLSVPFGQSYDQSESAHTMYVAGKEILNGVVSIQLALGATVGAKSGLVLHVSPVYNAVLVFGSGTADYAF